MKCEIHSHRRLCAAFGGALALLGWMSFAAGSFAQTIDISGTVTIRRDDGTLGPANVMIVLLPGNDATKPRDTLTDENGRYRFSGVEPGQAYVLLAVIRNKEGELVILKRLANIQPQLRARVDLTIENEDIKSATLIPVPKQSEPQPSEPPLRALGKTKAGGPPKNKEPQLQVQLGHSGPVVALAISRDGRFVLSTGNDDGVVLWDVATGLELRRFAGGSTWVYDAVLSPDGNFVLTGSREGAYLWDSTTGELIGKLEGHEGNVRAVKFSPDGKYALTGGSDHTARLWDIASGREIKRFVGHSATINSVAFSSDGQFVLTGSGERADSSMKVDPIDNTARLWSVSSGQELKRFAHSKAVNSVVFSPVGGMLATSADDAVTVVWRADTGERLTSFKGEMAGGGVPFASTLAWSADGNRILVYGGVWEPTKELWSKYGSFSGTFTADGNQVLLADMGGEISFYETKSGRLVRQLSSNSVRLTDLVISRDERRLLAGGKDGQAHLWDLTTGQVVRNFAGHASEVNTVDLSLDGRFVLTSGGRWGKDNTLRVWDVESGRELKRFDASTGSSFGLSASQFSADGRRALSGGDDGTVRTWDVQTGAELQRLDLKGSVFQAKFSPDEHYILTACCNPWSTPKPHTSLWEVKTGREVKTFEGQGYKAALSPDNRLLITGGDSLQTGELRLWNTQTGEEILRFVGHLDYYAIQSLAFSTDGRFILSSSTDKTVRLWETETRRQKYVFNHTDTVRAAIFTNDGRMAISTSSDGTTRFWSLDNGREICRLISLAKGGWIVVGPNGRFDTNDLSEINDLHWIMPDEPMRPWSLEIFMRDYYEPQLLPRLLRCNKLNNCEKEFNPVRDISKLNRAQPRVTIANVSPPDAEGYANVTVAVGKGEGKYVVNGIENTRTTGIYDLRLFRDGQIVGSWPRDGAERVLQNLSKGFESNETLTGDTRLLAELRGWRQATELKPDETMTRDEKTGMLLLPPFRVKLPQGKDAAQIEFSAYAFNEDRIKSQTAKWEWPNEVVARLPKAQAIKPRAYVIAVGVNAYENADFDLEFAADDARRMSQVVSQNLKASGQYEQVVPITLVSDYETRNCRKVSTVKQATKDNFRSVLELLSGNNKNRKLLDGVPNADQLQKATPDDVVLIMYSSHGYADRSGNFYFIPYDTGPGKGKVFTETVRQHSISSEELSLWLRDVDAGEMVMIVDACHSAAAIAGKDFKPGPMGSRGLGQLSYDKGMRILTATQSDNVAWEYPTLKQGVLTYALLRDGIEARQADHNKDNTITLAEWLGYGVERVPKLYQEVLTNSVQTFGVKPESQPTLTLSAKECGRALGRKELEEVLVEQDNKSRATQQPSLFDFTRKKPEVVLSRYPSASP